MISGHVVLDKERHAEGDGAPTQRARAARTQILIPACMSCMSQTQSEHVCSHAYKCAARGPRSCACTNVPPSTRKFSQEMLVQVHGRSCANSRINITCIISRNELSHLREASGATSKYPPRTECQRCALAHSPKGYMPIARPTRIIQKSNRFITFQFIIECEPYNNLLI